MNCSSHSLALTRRPAPVRSICTAAARAALVVGITTAITFAQTRVENQADPTSAGLEPLRAPAAIDPFGGLTGGRSITGPIAPTSFFELDRSVLDDPVLLFPEYTPGEIGFQPRPAAILKPLPGFANRPFDFSRFSLMLPSSISGFAQSGPLLSRPSDDEIDPTTESLFELTPAPDAPVDDREVVLPGWSYDPATRPGIALDGTSSASEAGPSSDSASRPPLAPRDYTSRSGFGVRATDDRPASTESADARTPFSPPIGDRRINSVPASRHEPGDRYLRQADELMQGGQFLRAVAQYELAIVADRANPRAHLGQAHAALAAGQYRIASRRILAAFRSFPELVESDIDLRSTIPQSSVLAARRMELRDQLERDDDYGLRFLIGYLDYFGGDATTGMEHLKAAAASAPFDSVVATLPERLSAARVRRESGASP